MKLIVFLAVATALAVAPAHADDPPCPSLVKQACFRVHGALMTTNGTPTFRIFLSGADRVLGIVGGEEPLLPASVRASLGDDMFSQQLWGDYEVCPQTEPRPGEMQLVCLRSGEKLSLVPR